MNKHLFKYLYIFLGAIIVSLLLFSIENKPVYQTQSVSTEDITKVIEFSTQIYPDYYTKIDLENKDEIVEVYVKAGDKVTQGTVLVQLNDKEEQKDLKNAWSLFNEIVRYRDQIRASQNSTTENYNELENNINDTEVKIENLINNIEEVDDETKNEVIKELEKTIDNLNSLVGSTENALSAFNISELIQPAINLAYEQVGKAQEKVEERKVKAPFDGTILYIETEKYVEETEDLTEMLSSFDLDSIMEGLSDPTQFLSSSLDLTGTTEKETDLRQENFVVISDLDKVQIYTEFSEKDILQVKAGMNVEISFESSGEKMKGTVATVLNFPLKQDAKEPTYGVVISLNEVPVDLLIGSTISGSINIYEKENAIVVPISAVSYKADESSYIYQLDENLELTEKVITLGNNDLTKVEVLEGLNEGDSIVVDKEKEKLTIVLRPWIKNILQKI